MADEFDLLSHFDPTRRPELFEMGPASCSVCGAGEQRKMFQVNGFDIVMCLNCGFYFTTPRTKRSALEQVYNETYYASSDSCSHGYQDYFGEKDHIIETFDLRWKWMQPHLPMKGRHLDVGCAAGFLLQLANGLGWDVYGVEPSAYGAGEARRQFGGHIVQGVVSEADSWPDGWFDLITAWDTLEHAGDPLGDVRRIHRMLKKEGVFSVIVPDRGSFFSRLLGPRWVEYAKPHEHLSFFSRRTMARLLEKAGFDVVDATTAGKYVPISFALGRLGKISPKWAEEGVWKPLGRLLGGNGAKVVYINPGDKMHVLARKKP